MELLRSFWKTSGSYLPLALYTSCALYLVVAGVNTALSNYFAEKAVESLSVAAGERASRWQPDNPQAYVSLGMVFLKQGENRKAVENLRKAVDLRQNDPSLWLLLGYASIRAGENDGAEVAYREAGKLAPAHFEPKLRLGELYLEASSPEQAFRILGEVADSDPELVPRIWELGKRFYPKDLSVIEEYFRPQSNWAKVDSAEFRIKNGHLSDDLRTFLLSDDLSNDQKKDLAGLLVSNKAYRLAYEVWLSAADRSLDVRVPLIQDGGFETTEKSDDAGFGWRINDDMPGFSASIDKTSVHSGSRSLRLEFDGSVAAGQGLLSQLVVVKPDGRYELKGYYLSDKMVTGGPPYVMVAGEDHHELLGASSPFETTDASWVEFSVTFTAKNENAVTISLVRGGCKEAACPIFGRLWLDDLEIVELSERR